MRAICGFGAGAEAVVAAGAAMLVGTADGTGGAGPAGGATTGTGVREAVPSATGAGAEDDIDNVMRPPTRITSATTR